MAWPFTQFDTTEDYAGIVPDNRHLPGPGASAFPDGDRLVRGLLFLVTFTLTWFTAAPFPDLSDPRLLAPQTSGDTLSQASMILLTVVLAGYAVMSRCRLLRSFITLPLILTFVAFAISALLSAYPDVAGRRLVLAAFTTFQAAFILLLPNGREHFARLLAAASLIVLAACYIGVTLFPHLSIHQASDIAEPGLAGDWRGFFTHKNGAGAGMALLIFIGIFVWRAWDKAIGGSIIVLAAVFLHFTHSKSPLNLLPIVLALSYFIPRARNAVAAFALVIGVAVALNLMSVGSVMFAPIKTMLSAVMSDPTFTGRDVIWQFALDHVAQRPLFGFGFESFWGMPDLVADWNYMESWGYRASDAHNGYLNLAVTTGLVSLGVALWWMVVQPFADLRRAHDSDRALTTLFVQIWLFGLYLGCFESVFFAGGSAVWFLVITAIAGLRFQATAKSLR
jgi:O-antigen ligase